MLRKLIFAVCVMALTLASCGHQVTPDRTTGVNGLPSGTMQVRFTTADVPDFNSYWYILAFNITGTGQPYAIYGNQQQNWLNYDFEIIVANVNGQPVATMYQFVTHPGVSGGTFKAPGPPLAYTPQQLFVTTGAACNGNPNSFCVNISRELFLGYLTGSSPSPSPSPTGSASPSPSPTGSTSPSPAPTGTGLPAGVWAINWFVASPGSATSPPGQVVDAPGIGGVNDTTFTFDVDTGTSVDQPWNAVPPPGWPTAPSPSAQIAGGEVLNSP